MRSQSYHQAPTSNGDTNTSIHLPTKFYGGGRRLEGSNKSKEKEIMVGGSYKIFEAWDRFIRMSQESPLLEGWVRWQV